MNRRKSHIATITLLSIGAFIIACGGKPTASTNSTATTNKNSPAAQTQTPAQAPAAASEGETLTHQEAGVQFDLPAGWQKKEEGDSLVISSPDGGVAVIFSVTSEDDWEKAVDSIGQELDKIIKDPQFDGDPKEGNLNGMATLTDTGTGTVEGQKIEWSFTLLDAKKPVLIVGFANPETWEKNQAAFNKMVDSIRKS